MSTNKSIWLTLNSLNVGNLLVESDNRQYFGYVIECTCSPGAPLQAMGHRICNAVGLALAHGP